MKVPLMNTPRRFLAALTLVSASTVLTLLILAGCESSSERYSNPQSPPAGQGSGGGGGGFTQSPSTNVPGSIGSAGPGKRKWFDENFDFNSIYAPSTQQCADRLITDNMQFNGTGSSRTKLGGPADDELARTLQPTRDQELWVIEKNPDAACAPAVAPGEGALVAKQGEKLIPIPLQHTEVKADITGYIASVDVTQKYANPYSEKIEAVYVFPLPENAAVNDFIMTIGDRQIRGIIRERAEAQKIYAEARAQGYVASLLQQERANVFTQSVANIEPGKAIDIDIKYFHTLAYVDGCYEWVFPMVVAPRFNMPGDTGGIGAVPRGAANASGQPKEVQYLAPSERSGHDIALAVHLDAGMKVDEITTPNHKSEVKRNAESGAEVVLAASDSIPNKDFVLRYKVAGSETKSAIFTQKDEKGGGYFTLLLVPPQTLSDVPRQPLEMVFTLDVSGSMSGEPIAQAKKAITYALQHMDERDTFQIIRFASGASQMAPKPVPATRENVAIGLKYIESTEAGGGTWMIEGIRSSLCFPRDASRLRFVSFMTDGLLGNEQPILAEIHNSIGPSRIFSFGVGSSPNRYLLSSMAKMGNGAAAYLGLHDDANEVMSQFFNRISHPALTDVSVDFGGAKVSGVYPSRIPDLFVGRPVIITGHYDGEPGAITVHGCAAGQDHSFKPAGDFADNAAAHRGISAVWARMKIADIAEQATYAPDGDQPGAIKQVALEHNLMSPFTSFVAVDSTIRTSGDHGTTVSVPVPMPEGVRYNTTVAPAGQQRAPTSAEQ